MKKAVLIFVMIILIASCKTSILTTDDTSQTTSLFNGNDLSGWTIYGAEKWYVEDGQLVCENGPDKAFSYLGTNEHYKNFELTLEFKQETNGNIQEHIHTGLSISKQHIPINPKPLAPVNKPLCQESSPRNTKRLYAARSMPV